VARPVPWSGMGRTSAVSVALAASLLGGACSPAEESRRTSSPSSSGASSPGPSSPGPSGPAGTRTPTPTEDGEPPVTQPLVVVVDAERRIRPPTRRAARRMVSGDLARWRGLRVVVAREPARAGRVVRRVERGSPVVGLVPADALSPTVRALAVGGADPVADPEAYPLRTPGEPPGRVLSLVVGGDVMLGRGVARAHPRDATTTLRPLRPALAGADLSVVNLESTLSDDGPALQGGDSFAADPAVRGGLAALGVDAVSLANNHTGDFGERALRRTLSLLERGPVPGFGAGRDLGEAAEPLVLRRGGTSVGLVGFNAIGETPRAAPGTPGALSVRMPPRTGPLVEADLRRVERIVRRLADRVDVVVVLPHWGTQYTHAPEPVQRRVARRLAGAGADLVVGGHPHWVQGFQRVGDALAVHSLGNLVFDMDFMEQTMEGVLLRATFWDGRLVAAEPIPYRMDAGFTARPLRGGAGEGVLADLWRSSGPPFGG
jgi:poly-gamma-glutamate capsule biosynthesis protein CapA/YwtB (metallophosphatase superfamily)